MLFDAEIAADVADKIRADFTPVDGHGACSICYSGCSVPTNGVQIKKYIDLCPQTGHKKGMKTGWMKLRVVPAEKTTFEEAAELAGLSLSAWARERLRRAAIRELEAASR